MIALAKLFDIVPGWIWAALLAAAMLANCNTLRQRDGARLEAATLTAAIEKQKAEAAQTLAAETGKVLKLERELGAARAQQEKADADNAKTVANLRADLRRNSRAAGGPGLRDPWAPRCGGGSGGPAAPTAPAADSGGTDAAEAGRVLSEHFEGMLLDWAEAADQINAAYIACRTDAVNLRATLALTP